MSMNLNTRCMGINKEFRQEFRTDCDMDEIGKWINIKMYCYSEKYTNSRAWWLNQVIRHPIHWALRLQLVSPWLRGKHDIHTLHFQIINYNRSTLSTRIATKPTPLLPSQRDRQVVRRGQIICSYLARREVRKIGGVGKRMLIKRWSREFQNLIGWLKAKWFFNFKIIWFNNI